MCAPAAHAAAGGPAVTGSVRYRVSDRRLWYTWDYIDAVRKVAKQAARAIAEQSDAVADLTTAGTRSSTELATLGRTSTAQKGNAAELTLALEAIADEVADATGQERVRGYLPNLDLGVGGGRTPDRRKTRRG